MTLRVLGLVRQCTALSWMALVAVLLVLLGAINLAPHFGHHIFAVRGAAMEPALPVGSLLLVRQVDPADLAVGDIITFRFDDRPLTRRITAVGAGEQAGFAVAADASTDTSGLHTPATALVGRVDAYVPLIGELVALMGGGAGPLVLLSIVGVLMLAGWSLDEQIYVRARPRRGTLALG